MDGTILIPYLFGENLCVRQGSPLPLVVDEDDSLPGELPIETLWRIEAARSFGEQWVSDLVVKV